MSDSKIQPIHESRIQGIKQLKLIGTVFYDDPFRSSKPWSYENEIGKTWDRFFRLYKKKQRTNTKE